MSLPDRSRDAEAAYLIAWSERDEPEALCVAVSEALSARRPQLAADLVLLLPDSFDDPTLQRARQAARLVLGRHPHPEDHVHFDAAWREARDGFARRARLRMRRRIAERSGQVGRFRTRR